MFLPHLFVHNMITKWPLFSQPVSQAGRMGKVKNILLVRYCLFLYKWSPLQKTTLNISLPTTGLYDHPAEVEFEKISILSFRIKLEKTENKLCNWLHSVSPSAKNQWILLFCHRYQSLIVMFNSICNSETLEEESHNFDNVSLMLRKTEDSIYRRDSSNKEKMLLIEPKALKQDTGGLYTRRRAT